ncbi:MAG: hypothetical protein IPQ02_16210 [Saprospiraceae bacterium]|nr:hypothetical protein [Candidatus Defluviibacterium haderslevense]
MNLQNDHKLTKKVHAHRAAYNSTFAIGGVSCSADSFGFAESLYLQMSICAEIPAHQKSVKRQ